MKCPACDNTLTPLVVAGMTVNVCQAFLHEAKYDQLHGAGKTAKLLRNVKGDIDAAALGQAANVPGERGG